MRVGVRVPEKAEQAHIVQLLRAIGGRAYVLGTVRRRGDHPGTMQSLGLPDVIGFLPMRRLVRTVQAGEVVAERLVATARELVMIECKAKRGRIRPEQEEFRTLCLEAHVTHLVGDYDHVIGWLVGQGYVKADQFPHYRQPAPVRGDHG